MIGTLVPVQFAGLLTPVASLEGLGKLIGQVYPATHMLTISRGVLQQGAGPVQPAVSFWLLAAIPVALGASALLLRKQER